MPATKATTESQDHTPSASVIVNQPETPEKIAGPQRVAQKAESFTAPPPSGAPSPTRSAELLAGSSGVGVASRAQAMRSLQRSVGNARVSQLTGTAIQTKLSVGAVQDPHEQEADRVAETITQPVTKPSSTTQRIVMKHSLTHLAHAQRQTKREDLEPERAEPAVEVSKLKAENAAPANSKEPQTAHEATTHPEPPRQSTVTSNEQQQNSEVAGVQRSASSEATANDVDLNMEGRIKSPSGGQPLPQSMQQEMETGLGADFSRVRVHDGAIDQADAGRLNAKAFTHGEHIWLGTGESVHDRKLLAHELTHVVQQGGGGEVRRQPRESEEANEFAGPPEAAAIEPAVAAVGVESAAEQSESQSRPASVNNEPTPRAEAAPRIGPPEAEETKRAGSSESTGPSSTGFDKGSPGTAETAQQLEAPERRSPPATGRVATEIPTTADAVTENAAQPPPRQLPESSATDTTSTASTAAGPEAQSTGTGDMSIAAPAEMSGASPSEMSVESHAEPVTSPAEMELPTSIPAEMPAEGDSLISSESLEPETAQNNFSAAALPTAISPAATSSAPAGGVIQRQENDDDDGILASIRRRIRGVVDGLSSGWNSLTQMAVEAFETVRGQIGGILDSLRNVVTAALTTLQNAWSSLAARVTQLADGIRRQVQAAATAVGGAIHAIGRAIMRLDPIGLRSAWRNLTGLLATVNQRVQQAMQSVFTTIAGLWQGLRTRFDGLVNNLTSGVAAVRGRVQSMVQGLRQRLSSAWEGLRNRATQLSGVLGGVLERLRSLVSGLLSWGEQIWGRIRASWDALTTRVSAFIQQLQQGAMTAWQALRARASGFWTRVQNLWMRLQQSVRQLLQRLASGLRAICQRIRALAVEGFIRTIEALARLIDGMRQLYENIKQFLSPIAARITDIVFGGMPERATGYAREQFAQAIGAATGSVSAPVSETEESTETPVQRVPRSTAGAGEIWTGFSNAICTMWAQLTWRAIFEMVLDALLEQLFPPLAVYRQVRDFIFQDMAAMVEGLYRPRNFFADPLGSLHDIYTNLFHIVSDFVMSLLRRLINILMAFMLWITIILTIIGAVGGSIAVGVIGGVLSALATLGIGAGAGAAGGAAAGGAAGAGVGFGAALLIGEALFFAFLAIHTAQIIVTLLDLATTLQSDTEKRRDYGQLAESAIAVGVGLLLLFLAWLAGTVSKAVAALIERLGIKVRIPLPPALSRFLRGLKSVRPGGAGELTPEEQAARLAAEQRLSTQIGGDLARQLVADVGPELAEEVVARLGANNVRRLGAELGSEAIVAIAESLRPEVVERLLDGGVGPTRINAAVTAGQAERLAALTTEQIGRLGRLSENGFNRIIQLPEAQFQRFANLAEPQLRLFADMNAAAFARFAALDDPVFARFIALTPDQIQAFAGLSDDAFNRFTTLDNAGFARFAAVTPEQLQAFAQMSNAGFDRFARLSPTDFAKFANLTPDALIRFSTLSDAAFNRFAALAPGDLVKFANVTPASLERLAALPGGELENMASTMSEAEIHRQVLGRESSAGRFRGPEADTALRLEARRGIVLDRFDPGPVAPGTPAASRPKGDWFDVVTGEVYDGCSPAPSRFFDAEIRNGNYETSLRDHLNHPTVDFVVIDITGLGLTTAQETTLENLINAVAGPGNPKIIRIP